MATLDRSSQPARAAPGHNTKVTMRFIYKSMKYQNEGHMAVELKVSVPVRLRHPNTGSKPTCKAVIESDLLPEHLKVKIETIDHEAQLPVKFSLTSIGDDDDVLVAEVYLSTENSGPFVGLDGAEEIAIAAAQAFEDVLNRLARMDTESETLLQIKAAMPE